MILRCSMRRTKSYKNLFCVCCRRVREMSPAQSLTAHIGTRGIHHMSKSLFTGLMLPLVLFLGGSSENYATEKIANPPTGTLQKMIVQNGSVTMDLDLNRLNGINSATQSVA